MDALKRIKSLIYPHFHSAEINILRQIEKTGNLFEILSFYFDFYYEQFDELNDLEQGECYYIFKGFIRQYLTQSDLDLLHYSEQRPEKWKKRVQLKQLFDKYVVSQEDSMILLRTLKTHRIFNIRAIEKEVKISRNTLSGFVNRTRPISDANASKVLRLLSSIGLQTF